MADRELHAGAATSVITPPLGVSLCGKMTDRFADNIHEELHARSLVLDNGHTRLALVVLDLFGATKEWLSDIKHQVHSFTGIPMAHVLVSCTHTHQAATTVPFFQSNVEKAYLQWASRRVADSVRLAVRRLQPARIGWAVGREERAVFNRRYFMKPGIKLTGPWPGTVDKVLMNPAPELRLAIDKPAGPTDPDIPILAVQNEGEDGRPLALFASYGLHYVNRMPETDVSADYFGTVADWLVELTGSPRRHQRQPFVALLANGCFGDINNLDLTKPPGQEEPSYRHLHQVAEMVARAIYQAWKAIKYHDWVPLTAREQSLTLRVRKPSAQEIQQAREVLQKAPQGPLMKVEDIYARETIQLADWPDTFRTTVQVFRIGDLALCALPGEPFCQTGLEIKAKSPFKPTMMVGMANDYAGYLPTEEQHALGGYETWRAKSSFLEVKAASKIQEAALQLLAAVAK